MIPRNIFKYLRLAKEQERPQTTEEQIEDLVNRLILKLKADGKSIDTSTDGHGVLFVWVHNLDTENATIELHGSGDWRIEVKPHFNKF